MAAKPVLLLLFLPNAIATSNSLLAVPQVHLDPLDLMVLTGRQALQVHMECQEEMATQLWRRSSRTADPAHLGLRE